jgi:hypothetical protein
MRAESDLTAEVADQSEISWSRPLSLQEAWRSASPLRRRWLLAAASIFTLGLLFWLVLGFAPARTLSTGAWLTVLGFSPLAGTLALGIALFLFMANGVPRPIEDPILDFVRGIARQVHGLTKVDLDQFEAALASLPPTTSMVSDSSPTFEEVIRDFDVESATTGDSLLSALQGSDPIWRPRLRDALVRIVREEQAGTRRQARAERLAAASPSARRRARLRPAVWTIAGLVVCAPAIGLIVLGLLGFQPEFDWPSGATIGSPMGLIVGWLGLQLTALPDASRDEYIKEIAAALSAPR